MPYFFVSSPYTLYPHGRDEAARLAAEQVSLLVQAGIPAYSGVVHGHAVSRAIAASPRRSQMAWLYHNTEMMRAAAGGIFVRAESWRLSRGMASERDFFACHGKPVYYVDVGEVPRILRFSNDHAEFSRPLPATLYA